MYISHFGIRIKEKESNTLTRNSYLLAKPEYMQGWREEDYPTQIQKAALNFDLNMRCFEDIEEEQFSKNLKKQCKKFKMKECLDLNELDGIEGLYFMVLDKYKQVYIGKSGDIKKRILQHWSKTKSLERLIWGDVFSSALSIDSFGALDTTRIFYVKSHQPDLLEEKAVASFDPLYTLNRISGGSWVDGKIISKIRIKANVREKKLLSYLEEKELLTFRDICTVDSFNFYTKKYPELQEMYDMIDFGTATK